MPSRYVLEALGHVSRLRRRELHENERPTALLTAVYVNSQRTSKNSKAVAMDSYYLYGDTNDSNKPDARYGAAAMALIDMELFPVWALFVYKDLSSNAQAPKPDPLALMHEDAIILAPVINGPIIKGMLICKETASNKRLKMRNEDGVEWIIDMPNVRSKIIAEENAELTYTRF